MSTEDLMKRRAKVIAPYPNTIFLIGEILYENEHSDWYFNKSKLCGVTTKDISLCKTIFRELFWWEDRDEKDMPEYYKRVGDGSIYKTNCRVEGRIVMLQIKDNETVPTAIEYLLPATEAQYLNSLKEVK